MIVEYMNLMMMVGIDSIDTMQNHLRAARSAKVRGCKCNAGDLAGSKTKMMAIQKNSVIVVIKRSP